MADQARELPVLLIDGARFDDFEGFQLEFSALLADYRWTGNLDAFNDILRGGFGTPEGGWILRWLNSRRSRSVLDHEAMHKKLEAVLATCHASNEARIAAQIESARRGEGPTLFDEIVEIIRIHGPGGGEEEDHVLLELL
jgi:hypothetical protein